MTTTKDAIPPPEASVQECCMCGDHGLSEELLQCRICRFRHQHRYCSNVYPTAQSYNICNWCLNQKMNETTNEKTQNLSSVASSLHKKESDQEERYRKSKRSTNSSLASDGHDHSHRNHHRDDKGPKATIQYPGKILNGPTKKRMMEPPERSPPSITKRILRSSGRFDVDDGQKLGMRRIKSETMMSKKQVLIRNKVRRYKLLDEVTS